MNYSELLDNVRSYTEVDSNVLSNSIINVFITNVENKVDRAIDSDSQRRYATTTCTANNAFLNVSGPEGGFRFARGLQLIDANNNISWIEQRDTTFIDEYSVTRSEAGSSTNGQPKYWANWDATNLILAPTPDQVYTIEMWYNETPERISNTNTTTFLSNNAPEVLLYGTIAEAYSFLKNPQDMQLYEAKFTSALKLFADEQMGRKRRDEYENGVLRIPLKSMDPGGN
jgi:hypothetical protein